MQLCEICTLHKIREFTIHLFIFRIGVAVPHNAPYKPNFDRVILRVVESGLVSIYRYEMILFFLNLIGYEIKI